MNSTNTVFDAKRLIGRTFTDAGVQSDMKHWPFKVVSGVGGTPIIEVEYKGETKQFKCLLARHEFAANSETPRGDLLAPLVEVLGLVEAVVLLLEVVVDLGLALQLLGWPQIELD